jgi:hypothetical protein
MSQGFFKDKNAESFLMPEIDIEISENKGNLRWGCRSIIDWTPQLKTSLLRFYRNCNYPYRQIQIIPFEEPLRTEVRYFFISLDAYIESPNPAIPEKKILIGSAFPDFAKTLKKIKKKSLDKSWNSILFKIPDDYESIEYYHFDNIGEIFNYAYLIHFREDACDYTVGLEPVKMDSDTLQEFEAEFRELLPEVHIEKIEDLSVLLNIRSTKSFDRLSKKKGSPL